MAFSSGLKYISLLPAATRGWLFPQQMTRGNMASSIVLARQFSAVTTTSDPDPNLPPSSLDDSKDRTRIIPVEVSMSYLNSPAYNETYGKDPVWKMYRRNFKGRFAPPTRKLCIRAGKLATGNPCPICRDEYLVLDYRNVTLLQQFISSHDGRILDTMKTGLCHKRQDELLVAIHKAKDCGLITFDVPYRHYDYSEYQ